MSEITGLEWWEQGLSQDLRRPRLVVDGAARVRNFTSIAWSSDGRLLAGADEQAVRLWSCGEQTQLQTLREEGAIAVAIRPDGRMLVAGTREGALVAWDVPSGKRLWSVRAHRQGVQALAFIGDGDVFASAGVDGRVALWAVQEGDSLKQLIDVGGGITALSAHPDRPLLAWAHGSSVTLWDLATGESRTLQASEVEILAAAFSPDGRALATGDGDGTIRLWNASSCKMERAFAPVRRPQRSNRAARRRGAQPVVSIAFSADGSTIAAGTFEHAVVAWNARSGKRLPGLYTHAFQVWDVAFNPRSGVLASGGAEGAIKLWRAGKHLDEVGAVLVVGEDDWAVVAIDEHYEASPGAHRHMHWVTGVEAPIEIDALHPKRRSGGLLSKLAIGKPAPTPRKGAGRTRQDTRGARRVPPAASTSSGLSHDDPVPALQVRTGLPHQVRCVALSPDGSVLASSSEGMNIELWDVATGRELRLLTGHSDTVTALVFGDAPDQLFSGSRDGTARVWNLFSGEALDTFYIGIPGAPVHVIRGSQQELLVFASDDGTIKYYHAATRRLLHILRIRERRDGALYILNEQVAVAPGAGFALRPHERDSVALVDLHEGRTAYEIGSHDTPGAVVFSATGKQHAIGGATTRGLIVIGARRGTKAGRSPETYAIEVRETGSGKPAHRLVGHDANVTALAFGANDRLLASGAADGTVRIWDLASGKCKRRLKTQSSTVRALAFSGDGRTLVSGEGTEPFTGRITLWDVAAGRRRSTLERHIGDVRPVCFLPDGSTLAAAGEDGMVSLWSLRLREPPRLLRGHTDRVFSLAVSADGRYLASASWDGTSRLWDAATGALLRVLESDRGSMLWDVAFGADGRSVVTCSSHRASLWEVPSGVLQRSFDAPEISRDSFDDEPRYIAGCVALSPDGRLLALGSDDAVVVWELTPSHRDDPPRVLRAHRNTVFSLTFSPDSATLASGGMDQRILLWDMASGTLVRTLKGHCLPGHVEKGASVDFSSDGRRLASGGTDGTIRLWDAKSGAALSSVDGHAGAVAWVRFDPSNGMLAAGSNDASASLWDVRDPARPTRICSLYSFKDGSWAVVDAQGRFDASNGGELEWLHWVVGLEAIGLSQLRERYYEPGLLQKLLGHQREALRDVPTLTRVAMYPAIELAAWNPKRMTARVRVTNRGGGIGRVVIMVNGKEMTADARGEHSDPNAPVQELVLELAGHPFLKPGKNDIRIQAHNGEGYLASRQLQWAWTLLRGRQAEELQLWAVVVGVSDYQGELDLRFAAKDAEDMAGVIQLAGARLFGAKRTHVRLLAAYRASEPAATPGHDARVTLGGLPTRRNIAAAFEAMHGAKATDVLVVYLAGHGVNHGGQDGDYYFLTADARTGNLADPAVRQQVAISSRELTDWIRQVPALKQVLMLDTCAAGGFVDSLATRRDIPSSQVRALERMRDRTGMYVLAGSAADAVSYESSVYGQGLLTYSLLLGIKGGALREDQFVDVDRLFAFCADRVPVLAVGVGGIQAPISATPMGAQPFDIGRLTPADRDRVPLSPVRPVVLPVEFSHADTWLDTLGLAAALNAELRERAARGRDAPLLFIDTRDYPQAYTLRGRYTIDGDVVLVQARAFRGSELVDTVSVTGHVDQREQLAREIMKRVLDTVGRHWLARSGTS